jgi:ornithine decarboxylase
MNPKSQRSHIQKQQTPFYIFDVKKLRENYRRFKEIFPQVICYYSTKTNSLPDFLSTLHNEGSAFDAASLGEIRILTKLGVNPSSILFTSPIKNRKQISDAFKKGVRKFTFDTLDEFLSLMQHAPKSIYLLRIRPPVDGSFYKYNDKFGADERDIKRIMTFAHKNKHSIHGICFHVGSQNMSIKPWTEVIKLSQKIIKEYHQKITSLRILNIGGGFPSTYTFTDVVSLEKIATIINLGLKNLPRDIEVWAEPGRVLVANTGKLICTIQKNVTRSHKRWLFVDMGVYHGLIEILESGGKLTYPIEVLKKGKLVKYSISGNTLDPDDIFANNVELPENLAEGDRIIFHEIGAYTTSFFTEYHSLPRPKIFFINKK